MNKTNTWLIRVFAVVLVFVCLIAYLNAQANSSLLRPTIEDLEYKAFLLRPKPSIEDLEYKALDKKRANAEYAANRDFTDYEFVKVNEHKSHLLMNCTDLEKLGAEMESPFAKEWDKKNNCRDTVYSIELVE